MKKLHMTWRYKQGGFWEAAQECDSSGVAKFYYGTNLVESPVATEYLEIEIENVEKAEELYKFIKGVSTQQWNDGYEDAIEEMMAFLKEEKH